MNSIVIRTILACSFLIVLSCSSRKPNDYVSVSIPFFFECKNTIVKAKENFERTSLDYEYTIGIDIEMFESKNLAYPELIGVAKLFSSDDWETLSGDTPKEFLSLHANSILSDCMPNNGASLKLSEIDSLPNVIDSYSKKYSNLQVRFFGKDQSIDIYYNDGSYSYLQKN